MSNSLEEFEKTYLVEFTRSEGINPETKKHVPADSQSFKVQAYNVQGAVATARFLCTLPALGQQRKIFVDGREFVDPTF